MDTNTQIIMKKFSKLTIFTGLFALILSACIEVDPLVEKLEFDRVFTPRQLEVRVRNRTTAEFTWVLRDDAQKYVLEISEDSMLFNNIIRTFEINRDQLPFSVALEGETRYSARLKGTSTETGDSKWATVTFMTDTENIFLPMDGDDVKATQATVRWPAGSEVTHLLITPGNTQRPISEAEKAAGIATI